MSQKLKSLKEAKLAIDLGKYSPEAEKLSKQYAQQIREEERKIKDRKSKQLRK